MLKYIESLKLKPDRKVDYRRIIDTVPSYLNSSGYLLLEIGYDQSDAVVKLLQDKNKYHDIQVIKDLGGNDRVISA